MKYFLFLIYLFLFINLNAKEIYIATENISYKTLLIDGENIKLKNVTKIPHYCTPVTVIDGRVISKNYIRKGRVICKRNLKKEVQDVITFDFGNIQIIKSTKILKTDKKSITIRNQNGGIEKIDKTRY